MVEHPFRDDSMPEVERVIPRISFHLGLQRGWVGIQRAHSSRWYLYAVAPVARRLGLAP